jgi:hypothetical protein
MIHLEIKRLLKYQSDQKNQSIKEKMKAGNKQEMFYGM